MQQPYGSGLSAIPRGIWSKFRWAWKRATRIAIRDFLGPLDWLGLERLRISKLIWAKDRIGKEVRNYKVLHPAQTVQVARPQDMDFVNSVQLYESGEIPLNEVFVCEVVAANFLPYLGLVANQNFEVFSDSVQLTHRFQLSPAYRSFRPRSMVTYTGPVSSVQRPDAYSFWHWVADCLPLVLTLEAYMEDQPLTLLFGSNLGRFQREMLALMLPKTFQMKEVPAGRWIHTDRFILPSYLTGRRHGYLPGNYYEQIRRRIEQNLSLPRTEEKPRLRLYFSRSASNRRRVRNEDAVLKVLDAYGFTCANPENMSMREQVELFQRSEVIAGPHGAALAAMVFAPHAKVLALYPQKHPGAYFYSMARSCGLEHFGLTHESTLDDDEIADFKVDLVRLEAILSGPMGLSKR
jgi:capsular polysaccharide biosynthesis protein